MNLERGCNEGLPWKYLFTGDDFLPSWGSGYFEISAGFLHKMQLRLVASGSIMLWPFCPRNVIVASCLRSPMDLREPSRAQLQQEALVKRSRG
jgi:hypothetical protein